MESRKAKTFVEIKNEILNKMSEQENLIQVCESNIETFQSRSKKWICKYLIGGFIALMSVLAVSFITYGYSYETFYNFKFVFSIVIVGFVANVIVAFNHLSYINMAIKSWKDIKEANENSLEANRKAIDVLNDFIYCER